MSDLIRRQDAIDAILAVTGNSSVRELYEHVQEHGLSEMWSGGVNAAIDIIIAVPPVHPEPCKDTISRKAAIDAVKHAWAKGLEPTQYIEDLPSAQADSKETSSTHKALDTISRQAAIDAIRASTQKYTGFMEMEMYTDDDAVEAIINLPSAQPEIIRCKDCKWHQGAECVRFADVRPFADDFCSRAERRTDG